MAMIERRFTADDEHIYFINNGIITRKNVIDFLNQYVDAYYLLQSVGRNVGWCTPGTCLMFTENDEIYRVLSGSVMNIMTDEHTVIKDSKDDGITVVEYDYSGHRDGQLIADFNYKVFIQPSIDHSIDIGDVPKSMKDGFTKCAMIEDRYSVYSIWKGRIWKEHIFDYISKCGPNWSFILENGADKYTCLYDKEHAVIRMMEDRLDVIKSSYVHAIKDNCETTVERRFSEYLYDYCVLEYKSAWFSEDAMIIK